MIRNIVLGLAGAVALISSANAADMYVPNGGYKDGPVYDNWTGLYAGVHAGGAWADFTAFDADGFNKKGSTTAISSDGVFGGATFGKNFQRGQIVFGLEADLGGMDLGVRKPLTASSGETTGTLNGGLYGDVTGRAGYLFAPNVLAYTKGGFAFYNGAFQVNGTSATVPGDTISTTQSNTFLGWTVGAGVEYALRSNWTIKAEYQYFDFGGQTVGGLDSLSSQNTCEQGNGCRFNAKDLTANAVSVGLNYRFSPASEPLK